MQYKDIKEHGCEICPLYETELCRAGYSDHRGGPIDPPCVCWSDDLDVEKERERILVAIDNEAERQYKAWKKEEEKKERNRRARDRRFEAKCRVRSEDQEIKRLRKAIRAWEARINFMEAMRISGEIMSGKTLDLIRHRTPAHDEIDALKARIGELEVIRAEKLKQFRKERKEKQCSLTVSSFQSTKSDS